MMSWAKSICKNRHAQEGLIEDPYERVPSLSLFPGGARGSGLLAQFSRDSLFYDQFL